MRTTLHIVLFVLASMAVAACHTPELTHCPEVDCPKEKVCDGHGGCAFPEQIDICKGHTDGDPCTYKDQTGTSVDGECAGDVCYPLGCGNGFVTPDEACDDGNNQSGDGCSADCRSAESCGNNIIDTAAGEQCDDGNTIDGDGCQGNCLQPRCGDNIKDVGLDEECDAGENNSLAPNAVCRPNCQLARCGDGVLDTLKGEVCDDGNNQAGDGCSGDCKSNEFCGNGVVDALLGEVCDDGNTVSGDGCAADCKSLEVCGNNVLDSARGEVCDDGNTVSGDGCSSDCKSLEVCGNMIIDAITEQCDLGTAMNSNAPDSACRTNCKLPRCGDTIIDPMHGEQCDNGLSNADAPNACRTNCQNPRCGDAIKDSGEVCDDGNTTSGDGCSANCGSLETCGNSIIDVAKGEQCDAGAANSNNPNAACRTNCQLRRCGDSIIDTTFGETCDLGAANSNAPDATCRTNCTLQRCGDGIVDTTKGEVCDDGNTVSGDGCSADCRSDETCGNAVIDTATGEQCDAGSSNANTPNAPCRTTCMLPRCGDNITDNTLLGEGCDMGAANSNAPDAACRTNCQPRRCGDGIVDPTLGEVCDDGNVASGDGCSADCKSLETCGNTIIDTAKGEQCDLGAALNSNSPNATCRTDCKLQRCGDSILDNLKSEQCDLGAANSNAPNQTCRTNCLLQRCGDNILDNTKGEACDDGNFVSGDGCSADCKSTEVCGNGIVDTAKNEQCDLGGMNSNGANATCRTDCTRQRCGDAIVDNAFGEGCDLGAANSNSPNQTCRTNCQPQRCGDGILDNTKGEICDDGNNTNGDGCSADCKSLETCGNGIVDTVKGEECDAGAGNSNAPNASCRVGCKLPKCGDGIVDNLKGEVCDAGVLNSMAPDASCRPTCLPPKCGDGVIDPGRGEVCDDSNTLSGDGCRSDCASDETCGNGILDPQKSEQCDDGNSRGYDGCSACKPESMVVMIPGSAPGARDLEVLVYDGARQKTVMFGGRSGTVFLADTWQWDGSSWMQLQPTHAPAPRYGAGAAYDVKRNRVVVFGGTTGNGIANDTWEFDGADWVQMTPASSPTARTGAALAYDAKRGKVILFGGTDSGGAKNDLYEWTGVTWSPLAATGMPSARSGARMVYDYVNNYVVMFGGSADTHTYTYDGANGTNGAWTDRGSTAGPTTGADTNGMAYEASLATPRVVLWGGGANSYEWSGSAWSSIAGGPSARTTVEMTYDAARGKLVLFGGLNGSPLADTWLRTSQTWAAAPALALPPARMRSSMGYDPLRKRAVLFGGQNTVSRLTDCNSASCEYADTWEWDGRQWLSITTSGTPSLRAGTVMDYDVNARTMRMYAGDYVTKPTPCKTFVYEDMYSYNGATWTLGTAAGNRSAARTAAAAWDTQAARMITFGGVIGDTCGQYGTETNETWYWDATGWHNAAPATLPSARVNAALAYDRLRNKTVLYSGNPRDGTTVVDTWEWNNTNWTKITTTSTPNQRSAHKLFYNPDSQHVTLFGNSSYVTGEDVWEWNGTTWTQRTQIGQYPSRYNPAVAFDQVNHTIVSFSGRDQDLVTGGVTQTFGLLQSRPNAAVESCTSSNVDYDKDGKKGCADDECWPVCDPLHPPGTTRPTGAPFCGDGVCNGPENCSICPGDCTSCTTKCGDLMCDPGESVSCPADC